MGVGGLRGIELSAPEGPLSSDDSPRVVGSPSPPYLRGPPPLSADGSDASEYLTGLSFDSPRSRGSPHLSIPRPSSWVQTFQRALGRMRRSLIRCMGTRGPPSLLRPLLSSRHWGPAVAPSSPRPWDREAPYDPWAPANGRERGLPAASPDSQHFSTSSVSGLRERRGRGLLLEASPAASAAAEGRERETASWDAVADLDRFVVGIYRYWVEGGLVAMLCSHACHLIVLGFTVYFSWFLLMFVNWHGILTCASPEACAAVPLLLQSPWSPWGPRQTFCCLYFLSLSVVVAVSMVTAFNTCRDAVSLRAYFRSRLYIHCDSSLQLMGWPEVAALLLHAQQQHPFCLVKQDLSVLDLVSIIMRKDNYIIALTNREVLTRALPMYVHPKLLYTRVLLWSLRTAIFYNVFDKKQHLRQHLFASRAPYGYATGDNECFGSSVLFADCFGSAAAVQPDVSPPAVARDCCGGSIRSECLESTKARRPTDKPPSPCLSSCIDIGFPFLLCLGVSLCLQLCQPVSTSTGFLLESPAVSLHITILSVAVSLLASASRVSPVFVPVCLSVQLVAPLRSRTHSISAFRLVWFAALVADAASVVFLSVFFLSQVR